MATLETLIRTRGGFKARVTVLSGQTGMVIATGDAIKIDTHRQNLEHYLKRIQSLDDDIVDRLKTDQEVEDEVASATEYRQTVLETIEVLRKATYTPKGPRPVPMPRSTKLPKINLPFFSGNQIE